jgi:hypothetical protein
MKNPRAFPASLPEGHYSQDGMTLRDYFADSAMNSLLFVENEPEKIARRSYEMANAMLKARQKFDENPENNTSGADRGNQP